MSPQRPSSGTTLPHEHSACTRTTRWSSCHTTGICCLAPRPAALQPQSWHVASRVPILGLNAVDPLPGKSTRVILAVLPRGWEDLHNLEAYGSVRELY